MRLPAITPERYTTRQSEVAERIAGQRGGQVRGPFLCLLQSPELCDRVESLASFLRFKSALPEKLREFSLLIAARYWDAQDSWNAHVGKAVAAGLPEDVIQALAAKQPLDFAATDERDFYRFCKELLETHFVNDATYAAARSHWDDATLVEAVACLGTFSLMALCLNAFEVDLDPRRLPPFPDVRGYARFGARQPLG